MKKFALIGHNISYTMSGIIHPMIMTQLGLKASFEVFDVEQQDLESQINNLRTNYDGFNVTKPYKIKINDFLKQSSSPVTAVNCVVVREGELYGFNTDGDGFLYGLQDFEPKGKNALVLGAGGAAEIVAAVLAKRDCSVHILARNQQKQKMLAESTGTKQYFDSLAPELIINATPVGQFDDQNPLPDFVDTSKTQIFYDLIYSKQTAFLRSAPLSAQKIDGKPMLIAQAIKAQQLFWNINLTKEAFSDIFKKTLSGVAL